MLKEKVKWWHCVIAVGFVLFAFTFSWKQAGKFQENFPEVPAGVGIDHNKLTPAEKELLEQQKQAEIAQAEETLKRMQPKKYSK